MRVAQKLILQAFGFILTGYEILERVSTTNNRFVSRERCAKTLFYVWNKCLDNGRRFLLFFFSKRITKCINRGAWYAVCRAYLQQLWEYSFFQPTSAWIKRHYEALKNKIWLQKIKICLQLFNRKPLIQELQSATKGGM
jgi:hypothetical protein